MIVVKEQPDISQSRTCFYWIICRMDVEEWCKQYDLCLLNKSPRTRANGGMMIFYSHRRSGLLKKGLGTGSTF